MTSKKKIAIIKFILLTLLIPAKTQAQDLLVSEQHFGGNIGLNLAFGTHFQRLGLNFNFFYINDFFQANSEIRVYMNFKNLGPKKIHPELVLSQGVVFGYGKLQSFFNPFISSISNQTGYANAFAYSYNAWFNPIRTRQQTGLVAFQFDRVSFIAENDILARGYYDRFRTGGFLLQYQYENQFQAAVNCALWTGKMGRQVHDNREFNAVCYMDTTGGLYTRYSHGLLSAQFKYNVGYSQTAQANVGVDAEQIRNAVQNKLIHDMVFIPRKWITLKNCHIPMLDDKGEQYLHKPAQKIRKAKPYFNVFSNANLFY
ncbi:MAG TPA: polymorphic toxin type 23 domain-containing protein [Bacteroidia bacterium]|nr:polymorphic toxin type 23 domain-containing protein [Bacteroidia bacterium]